MTLKSQRYVGSIALTVLVWIAAIGIALIPVVENCLCVPKWSMCEDFKSYYGYSLILRGAHPEDVYKTDCVRRTVISVFPEEGWPGAAPPPLQVLPFALPLVFPISFIPANIVCPVWTILLLLCALAATSMLAVRCRMSPLATGVLFLVVALSGPYHSLVRLGELAPIGLLLLAFTVLSLDRKNNFLAALTLCPMVIKPHWILGFLAYLFGARKFKVHAWFSLFTGLLVLTSALCFGTGLYQTYAAQSKVFSTHPSIFGIETAVSFTAQVHKLLPNVPYPSITPYTAAVYALGLFLLCWLGNRLRARNDWLERGIASSFPVAIACSFYYSAYDLFFLTPALIMLLGSSKLGPLSKVNKFSLWLAVLILTNPQYHLLSGTPGRYPINPFYAALLIITVVALQVVLAEKPVAPPSEGDQDSVKFTAAVASS